MLPEDKLTRVISARLGGEVLRTDALLLSDLVSQVLKTKAFNEEQALSEGATFMALWDTRSESRRASVRRTSPPSLAEITLVSLSSGSKRTLPPHFG